MKGGLAQRLRNDVPACVAVGASLFALLLCFVYFDFGDAGFRAGAYSLPIEADGIAYIFERFFSGDMADIVKAAAVLPLYLLRGLAYIAITVAPAAMIALSAMADGAKRKKALLVAALVVNAAGYLVSNALWGIDLESILGIGFGMQILTMAVFLVCILALPDKKLAAPIACAALCFIAFIMTLAAIHPFGYDLSYFGKTHCISTFFRYAFFWTAIASAILSLFHCESLPSDPRGASLSTAKGRVVQTDGSASLLIAEASGQIKSLKELLDMGAISQEEFEKKKKELLGL